MKVFSEEDKPLVVQIDFKSKGTAVLMCKDWNSCQHISTKYEKSKLLGKEISFIMFSDNNPEN